MFRRCSFPFCFLESQYLFKGETQKKCLINYTRHHTKGAPTEWQHQETIVLIPITLFSPLYLVSPETKKRNVSKDCCSRWWRWLTELDSKRSPAAVCPSAFPTRSSRAGGQAAVVNRRPSLFYFFLSQETNRSDKYCSTKRRRNIIIQWQLTCGKWRRIAPEYSGSPPVKHTW